MNDINEVLKDAQAKMAKTIEVLEKDFSMIRTGRANTNLVAGIKVSYYGTPTPMSQVANIAASDARTISIRPWDAGLIKEIEKAIIGSDLGITPSNDGKVVRLNIPPLTGERRKQLVNQINDMAEKARVAIRNVRREALKSAEDLKKNSLLTEDQLEKSKKEIQDLTNGQEKKVGEVLETKRKEIMEI